MARLDQKFRLVDRTKTVRQKFLHTEGGMFISSEEAKKDGFRLHGKQNKHRGTLYKHKRKIAHESRRRNRASK